jgi:hypothetical protein
MRDTTATTEITATSDMSAMLTGYSSEACRGAEGARVIGYYAMGMV